MRLALWLRHKSAGLKKKSFFPLSAFLLALTAYGASADGKDPYYAEGLIEKGWMKGMPVVPVKRSIEYLSEKDAARFNPKDGELVFANFEHDQKLWIVKLNPKHVEKATFVIEPFGTFPANSHTNLRFTMKPGYEIELYPQTLSSSSKTPPVKLRDLIVSDEGFSPSGGPWKINMGLVNHENAFAYRVKSVNEILFETKIQTERPLIQVPMCMESESCAALLKNNLDESDKKGLHETYHLMLRNCTSELFRQIDAVHATTPLRKIASWIGKWGDWLPGWSKKAVQCRGLMDEEAAKSIRNLEVEQEETLLQLRTKYENEKNPLSGAHKIVANMEHPERALVLSSSDPDVQRKAETIANDLRSVNPHAVVIIKNTDDFGGAAAKKSDKMTGKLSHFIDEGLFSSVVPAHPTGERALKLLRKEERHKALKAVDPETLPTFVAAARKEAEKAAQVFGAGREKFVLFWGSYGNGHKAASEAIRDAILKQNPHATVEMKDIVDFLPKTEGEWSKKAFEYATRFFPEAYDMLYNWYMNKGMTTEKIGDMPAVHDYSFKEMAQWLQKEKPAVILSTFQRSTEALIAMREEGILPKDIPLAWQHTDYISHPYLAKIANKVDMTFVPHPELERKWTTQYGLSAAKVMSSGMPIKDTFFHPQTPAERQAFLMSKGLDPAKKTITLMSGINAVGDYPKIVKSLAEKIKEPVQIVAICAKNPSHPEALEKLKAKLPPNVTLQIEKLVPSDDVANYIKSSSIFIGKAGGLSSTETFVIGIPSIFLDNNGGQERGNIEFFEEMGLARGIRDESKVGEVALSIFENQDAQQVMADAQAQFRNLSDIDAIGKWASGAAKHHYNRYPAGIRLDVIKAFPPEERCPQYFKPLAPTR